MKQKTLWLYDDIGFDGWTTAKVRASLNHIKNNGDIDLLDVRIASQGGSTIEMNGIIAAFDEFKQDTGVKVRAIVDVVAASAAADIALAVSDEILTQKQAPILVHNSWGMVIGGSEDLRSVADEMDIVDAQGVKLLVNKTGMTEEDAKALIKQDRLIYPEEAISLKIVDGYYVHGEVNIELLEAYKAKLDAQKDNDETSKKVIGEIGKTLDAHYSRQRLDKVVELRKKLGGGH